MCLVSRTHHSVKPLHARGTYASVGHAVTLYRAGKSRSGENAYHARLSCAYVSYAATISREAYDYQSAEYTREQVDKLMASPEYGAFRRKKCWDWVKWQTLLYLCALLAGLWIAFRFLKEDPEEEGKR